MKKKVFITTTMDHCEMNSYDANIIEKYTLSNNFILANNMEDADTIIVFTCIFNDFNEDNSKQFIINLLNKYPNKEILVGGCLPTYDQNFIKKHRLKIVSSDLVNNHRFLPLTFNNYIDSEIRDNSNYLLSDKDKVSYIKISKGCIHNCTFCAIKIAKGLLKSLKRNIVIKAILKSIKRTSNPYIVLLSDDAGSYGVDIGDSIINLLNEFSELVSRYNIRLIISDWHPAKLIEQYKYINPEIWKWVHYVNIPIQSFSERILKLMNRNYKTSDVLNTIGSLRKINPKMKVTTHILYAFPTETVEEFQMTVRNVEYFDRVIFSCYCDKTNTKASLINPKVSENEKIRRTIFLLEKQQSNNKIKLAESNIFYKTINIFSKE